MATSNLPKLEYFIKGSEAHEEGGKLKKAKKAKKSKVAEQPVVFKAPPQRKALVVPKRAVQAPLSRKVPIELFKGKTSKAKLEFEKLSPAEKLALIELEKLKRQLKAEREKITAIPEESQVKPPPIDPEYEKQVLAERIESAIQPRSADVARLEELKKIEPAEQPVVMKAITSLSAFKKTPSYKSLSKNERERLKLMVLGMEPADRKAFFQDFEGKPVARITSELKSVLSVPETLDSEGDVTGSGLKLSKAVSKRVLKKITGKYKDPMDVGIIIHTIKHPKIRARIGGKIENITDDILARFEKAGLKDKFHARKDLKKVYKTIFGDLKKM